MLIKHDFNKLLFARSIISTAAFIFIMLGDFRGGLKIYDDRECDYRMALLKGDDSTMLG